MPKLDKEGEFNSIKIAKGVYASLVTVMKITDLSNYPGSKQEPYLRNDGTPYDLCIEVEYERDDGVPWSTRFYGNFKKDRVTGKVTGWQAFANGVQRFFETMLGDLNQVGELLKDNWSISTALKDMMIGRKFYRISYISGMKDDGKGKYKDWNQVFLEDATIEQMQESWGRVAVKMKTYTPDAVDEIKRVSDEESGSFDYGANTEQTTGEAEEEFEL